MSTILTLCAVMMRSPHHQNRPSKNATINIACILFAVSLQVFCLSIYDGYTDKIRRMIFTIIPHATLTPIPLFAASADVDATGEERERCERICSAPSSILASGARTQPAPQRMVTSQELQAFRTELERGDAVRAVAPILFQNKESVVQVGEGAVVSLPLRYLGVIGEGPDFAPQIDLLMEDDATRRSFAKGDGILITESLAAELGRQSGTGLVAGSTVLKINDGDRTIPLSVAGFYRLGVHGAAHNTVIAPIALLRGLFHLAPGTEGNVIGLTFKDPWQAETVRAHLDRLAARNDYFISTWRSGDAGQLSDQLDLYRWIMFVALCSSLLVVLTTLATNFNIVIMDREREIGLLRVLGLSGRRICAMFLLLGIGQALVGSFLGYGVGLVAGRVFNGHLNRMIEAYLPLGETSIGVDPAHFAPILAFVLLVCLIASLLAARRAVRLDPIENLRSL